MKLCDQFEKTFSPINQPLIMCRGRGEFLGVSAEHSTPAICLIPQKIVGRAGTNRTSGRRGDLSRRYSFPNLGRRDSLGAPPNLAVAIADGRDRDVLGKGRHLRKHSDIEEHHRVLARARGAAFVPRGVAAHAVPRRIHRRSAWPSQQTRTVQNCAFEFPPFT